MSKTPENRSKVTFIYTLADPVTKKRGGCVVIIGGLI